MTPRCSIIIRCHNEERHIGQLLDGIAHQSVEDVEIILVDSGSTDGTLTVAERYPVKVLRISPEDFSFGRSLNIGCAAARGDVIVLASAHVYPVYRDWLARLLAPFENPGVALVYGRQIGDSRTKYSEHRVFAKWFPPASNPDQHHSFCNNANAAVRRAVWEKIPYDESLTGLEDLDWAVRAQNAGHRIAYAAGAVIVHVHEETPKRIYNRYRREAIALKRIFPHERVGFKEFVRLLVGNVVSDWYHAAHDGVLHRTFFSILLFRAMQFWGTYRGFAQRGPITSDLKQRFYYPTERSRGPSEAEQWDSDHRIQYSTIAEKREVGRIY